MEIGFGRRRGIALRRISEYCAYTGQKFTKKLKPTFEHILPESQGGGWNMNNGLATIEEVNRARDNMRFDEWLKMYPCVVKNIQKYLDRLRGIKIRDRNYVEEVKVTLNREARGVVAFRGNKINKIV